MNFINNNTHPKSYVLTADIGGSHITSALFDVNARMVVDDTIQRVEFSSKTSADRILDAWCKCLLGSFAAKWPDPLGVAIAMPGPFDYEQGICYIKGLNKYEALYGLNIRKALSGRLGVPPERIQFRNDAESTIAGEVSRLTGTKVLGVTLGTGFGSALFDGRTTRDINLGSERHKDSIADDYFSTRWFLKRYFEQTGISVTGVKELAALANDHPTAKVIFNEFAVNLSDFLMPYLSDLQPDLLILCGNITKASNYFIRNLRKRLPVKVEIGALGEIAPLKGAVELFQPLYEPF
ncbi:hypothetical protein BEL04_12290 [Mucilaginibacter sp. PPCGB 2223]|nr:hypothetical protein BEL04_12290 [Mucilaginibacter sp. PPCGB 2223]